MPKSTLNLDKEIIHLIKEKPFFAHFLQTMNRVIVDNDDEIQTAGVNITDKINLYLNPKFFKSLRPLQRVAILEHELIHLLNKHPLRAKNRNQIVFNIAADIAVNQFIQNLPEGALLPEQFKLERNKETEYYYKKLMKDVKFVNVTIDKDGIVRDENGNKIGKLVDNHAVWDKGSKDKDWQHQLIKNAIKKTLEHTKDYGHLPGNIQEEIRKALLHETANWRHILQRFVHRATIVNVVPTRKKLNRRYGFYYDGSRVECKLDLLVAIDTSGSISDRDLSLFFAEIDKIKALGMKIAVAEIDTVVHKFYKYTHQPKVVCGRGGTELHNLFYYVRDKIKLKPNAIIYFTDLYANLKFKNPCPLIPILWVITEQGGEIKNIPFGTGIKLKNDIGSI